MVKIDVLGMPCPIPVVKAKAELTKEGCPGVILAVDNIVAVQNLEKMSHGLGYQFSYTEKETDLFMVEIKKNGGIAADIKRDEAANERPAPMVRQPGTDSQTGLVVAISRRTMGSGSEELGSILIKGFLFSLTTLAVPPTHVLFFNGGAHLTAQGANTIEDLTALEEKGTKILTCGTCLNYYGLTEKLAVGAVADMYGIVQTLAAAEKVINI